MFNVQYVLDLEHSQNYILVFLQVIKKLTDGGADFSFECIGDTNIVSTALQSSCDVSLILYYRDPCTHFVAQCLTCFHFTYRVGE